MTWPLGVGSAGKYRLYARWASYSGRNSAAPYAVTHDGGTTTVTFDQRYKGGEWISLGEYDLAPSSGHQVVLSDLGAGSVSADAILVVPLDQITPPPPLSVAADAVKLVANDAEDVLYVHADHLGAPQKMTDDTGAVVWDAAFTPFGQPASITGAASNDNRLPGQSLDDETALHYNYWRYYDPTLGRYLQSDPIGLAGGLNTYAYVGGNPVMRVDPTGEVFWPVIFGAAIGGGAEYYRQSRNNESLNPCKIGVAALAGTAGGGIGSLTTKYGLGSFLAINAAAGTAIGGTSAGLNGGDFSDIVKGMVFGGLGGSVGAGAGRGVSASFSRLSRGAAQSNTVGILAAGGDVLGDIASGLAGSSISASADSVVRSIRLLSDSFEDRTCRVCDLFGD